MVVMREVFFRHVSSLPCLPGARSLNGALAPHLGKAGLAGGLRRSVMGRLTGATLPKELGSSPGASVQGALLRQLVSP